VEITQAAQDRLSVLADVFGRAFVTEPMMQWPLGEHGDIEQRTTRAFEYFLESLIERGLVWEAGRGMGAAVWIPPAQLDAWEEAQRRNARIFSLADDGGRRWDAFWEWVESKTPDEPLWLLDSVAVEPGMQGRGIGSALIEFGLTMARAADATGMFLETGTSRNVPLYERFGFRVVEAADAPAAARTSGSCAGTPDLARKPCSRISA
jgi:GNAT superfamily N-acetyltransferase